MIKKTSYYIILFVGLGLITPWACAFTLVTFSGSVFNSDTTAMDTAMGLSNHIIEDFSDTTLVSGLSIQYNSNTPITALPGIFNVNAPLTLNNGESFAGGMPNNSWDGEEALVNNEDNRFDFPFIATTTFHIADGTTSFGVGMANMQKSNAAHDVLVNGVKLADLTFPDDPNYTDGIFTRNIYFIVQAEAGETINSVSLQATSTNEALVFDHVAILSDTVPEPSSWVLLLGAMLWGIFPRKK